MTGRDVRPGDELELPTGRVQVLAVYSAHGGRELTVRPAGGNATRVLWVWPQQLVNVAARSVESGEPGDAIGCRPVRGAVLDLARVLGRQASLGEGPFPAVPVH